MRESRTINVQRYKEPVVGGYVGTVEPETSSGAHPSWLLYFRDDGSATLYTKRELNGGCIGDGFELPAIAHEQMMSGLLEVSELDVQPHTKVEIKMGGNSTLHLSLSGPSRASVDVPTDAQL